MILSSFVVNPAGDSGFESVIRGGDGDGDWLSELLNFFSSHQFAFSL